MRSRVNPWTRAALLAVAVGSIASAIAPSAAGQSSANERAFPQSKAAVERALETLQASLGGHLPVLEGFAETAEHPLDRYSRGYYQTTAQITSTTSGGSLVRVTAKVTAWYSDPVASRSGYQLLKSNGRLETDLLDQLAEQLAKGSATGTADSAQASTSKPTTASPTNTGPKISATPPKSTETAGAFSSSRNQSLAEQERASRQTAEQASADKATLALRAEAQSLEEILKNQAHPKNLVAVRKSGTPVVATPSLNAKAEFLASMHDEFEMLDFNADWVHVRISGLSRGWIWRNSVEMPEGIPDTAVRPVTAQTPVADLFHVLREETAPFPGDWEPLRGRNVKIISVQKIDEGAKDIGPKERLEYTKSLLDQSYAEMAKPPQELAGLVVIFDSADGGMIAATLSTLQQWKGGKLSDSAMWHKCFFDPPETFDSAGSSASQ